MAGEVAMVILNANFSDTALSFHSFVASSVQDDHRYYP